MDYDKIILEMLSRIQTLEEQVQHLQELTKSEPKGDSVTTACIREYIQTQKADAAREGQTVLTLRASEIHRAMGLNKRYPMVCNAMRQCMGEGDQVLHETPSGYSSSLEIQYLL